jgi:pimeloyl-ACP methyl ester carboxylesterase
MGTLLTRAAFAPPELRADYDKYVESYGGQLEYVVGKTTGARIPVACFRPAPTFGKPVGVHPGTGSGPGPGPDVTILFSHGNSEDLRMCAKWLRSLADKSRTRVVAYDYTGYGKFRNSTRPSEASTLSNIVDVYTHVLACYPTTQVVLMGYSLGSGPSCYLASLNPVRLGALVLVAPFASILSVGLGRHVPGLGHLDMFANYCHGRKIMSPTLIVHGERDALTRPFHAKVLAEAIVGCRGRSVTWVRDGTHNSILNDLLQEAWVHMRRFLSDHHLVATG